MKTLTAFDVILVESERTFPTWEKAQYCYFIGYNHNLYFAQRDSSICFHLHSFHERVVLIYYSPYFFFGIYTTTYY
jgi:hypothetical protein